MAAVTQGAFSPGKETGLGEGRCGHPPGWGSGGCGQGWEGWCSVGPGAAPTPRLKDGVRGGEAGAWAADGATRRPVSRAGRRLQHPPTSAVLFAAGRPLPLPLPALPSPPFPLPLPSEEGPLSPPAACGRGPGSRSACSTPSPLLCGPWVTSTQISGRLVSLCRVLDATLSLGCETRALPTQVGSAMQYL